MFTSELVFAPWTVIYGAKETRVRVQVYLPLSEVDRGDKEREILSVETLPSPNVVTAEPFTVHVAVASTGNGGLGL